MSLIMVLGDVHLPFQNNAAIREAYEWRKAHKPDIVIQIGDLTDQKAWSRFAKDVDDMSPTLEWMKTVESAKELAEMFPEMTILFGNHDRRIAAKATEASLPKALVREMSELFDFAPGWKWHVSNKPLVVDGIAFVHGDEMAGNVEQKAQKLGQSVIQGHTHKSRLVYCNTFNKQIFGMDVGCLIDAEAIAFRYSAKNPTTCWLGFGVIADGVPMLVPYSGGK